MSEKQVIETLLSILSSGGRGFLTEEGAQTLIRLGDNYAAKVGAAK